MIASFSTTLPLDVTFLGLSAHLLAPRSKEPIANTPKSKVDRLYKWRASNPGLFEARRIAGMKRSARVRENLQRIHAECKAEWRASALKNPKLQATDRHIAAKEWVLQGSDGQVHAFRNLKKFIRDNPGLFDEADTQWKHPEGKPNQAWCRAFQYLSRLRPTCFNRLAEWQGWTWAAPFTVKNSTSAQYPIHFSAATTAPPLRAA